MSNRSVALLASERIASRKLDDLKGAYAHVCGQLMAITAERDELLTALRTICETAREVGREMPVYEAMLARLVRPNHERDARKGG